jgi:peptide/nickel transport system permease protein
VNLLRILARRPALGFVAAWTVLTLVFVLFTATDDWLLQGQVGIARWGGASDREVAAIRDQYLASRGLDRPLLQQYLDWMGGMLTLDWGQSFSSGEAVFPLVMGAAARTAKYVVPALLVGIVIGVLIGLYAALRPDSRLAGASLGSAYLLFALPNFWVGALLLSLAYGGVVGYSALVFEHLLPIALVVTTLLGGYASYARAYSFEQVSADFVTLVTAKGAGRRRVATHVLRNAAIPVFSMLFTEALGLLVLSVFVVETLFGIDGFGLLLFDAVRTRDLPVLLGGTVVIIGVGVVGNVVQDVSYGLLDPRVDTGRR